MTQEKESTGKEWEIRTKYIVLGLRSNVWGWDAEAGGVMPQFVQLRVDVGGNAFVRS
jgi:hypothetical protein